MIILVDDLSAFQKYIYNKRVTNSICKIYVEKTNNVIVFDHLSTATGFRKARIALNKSDVKRNVICASWNKEEARFGIIKDDTTHVSEKEEDRFFHVKFDEHGSITNCQKHNCV